MLRAAAAAAATVALAPPRQQSPVLLTAAALLRRHLARPFGRSSGCAIGSGGVSGVSGVGGVSSSISNGSSSSSSTTTTAITSRRAASTLVLAERSARSPAELAGATRSAVAAARQLLRPVHVLVAGGDAPSTDALAAAAAAVPGVAKVLLARHACLERTLAPPTAALLAAVARRERASCVLAAASTHGKDVVPRASALLGAQAVPDVVRILPPSSPPEGGGNEGGGSEEAASPSFSFVHPIYAGNALETVRYKNREGVAVLTVRPTAFPADDEHVEQGKQPPAPVEPADAADLAAAEAELRACPTAWVSDSSSQNTAAAAEKPDLGSARVVVCGGRALKSAENFAALERLAALLGGAVGASRAAVDAGLVPSDLQVGQTGKVVAPDLYVAVGVSGAIQHVAGMKDSRVVVAINTDGDAPIFHGVADYGLVADWQVALPELEARLRELKAKTGR